MGRRPSTRSARLSTVSLNPNLDEYIKRRRPASVVPKNAYSTDRVALKVLRQGLGVRAVPSMNWRLSTSSAPLSTVSLVPNLDEYLRRRHQAPVVPKGANCTELVALKVLSRGHGGNWRTSTRSARLSTVSLDPNLDANLRRRHQASVLPKLRTAPSGSR
jgi:hypothetical protein